MKKIISIALVGTFIIGVFTLASCSNNNQTEQTEPTTIAIEDKDESSYKGLDLEEFAEGDTQQEAESNAVTGVGKDKIDELFKQDKEIEETIFDDPLIHLFDEGFVAEYNVQIKKSGTEELQNDVVLGFYITIKQDNGKYKTYFISLKDMGDVEQLDEDELQKMLQAEIDKIKENTTKPTDNKQEPTEAPTESKTEEPTAKPTEKVTEPTTKNPDENPEGIGTYQDKDIEF